MLGWWDHFWDAPQHRPDWATLKTRRMSYTGFFWIITGWLTLWLVLGLGVGGARVAGWVALVLGFGMMALGFTFIIRFLVAQQDEAGDEPYESWANRPSPAYRGWIMATGMVIGPLASGLKLYLLTHHP